MFRTTCLTRNFLSILDLDPGELEAVLALAARLKQERGLGWQAPTSRALAGQHVALLFEKPSLRTRCTFEIGIHELGGEYLHVPHEVALRDREKLSDVAQNLELWVSAIVIRTFAQQRLAAFAAAAPRLRVINALTNEQHPCQALGDWLTLVERWGSAKDRTIAFVGDGNNVARSLMEAGALLGATVHLGCPDGYHLPERVLEQARAATSPRAEIRTFIDPAEAVRGADVVYTDTWTSMGFEAEAEERRQTFAPYQVNARLMSLARPEALFMHCLPAHRGEEVTDEVIDSSASAVLDQSENRLHTQKAILLTLMGG
ncbi:MAG: ornithine carbamoyltransferase [Acidobacteria bacterium]|nr:ornithine carbamoyltransferase [Acidobacteriota bacterium]MBI3264778.1 ornithine carbamoyltransferase [Acidobacteriota bacterium]